MGLIDPQIPVAGGKTTNEEPKIISAIAVLKDAINGGIGPDNIEDDAITAPKLATNSVTADAVATGAVGTDELAALAVNSSKIQFASHQASGTPATSIPEVLICQQTNVGPGYYLAIGSAKQIAAPRFTTSGGSVGFISTQYAEQAAGADSDVQGIIVVTATTTVQMLGVPSSPCKGIFTLFGVKA